MIAELKSRTEGRSLVAFTQCAWCGSISVGGHYLRLPCIGKVVKQVNLSIPMLPQVQFSVSHGICPSCAQDMCATAPGR